MSTKASGDLRADAEEAARARLAPHNIKAVEDAFLALQHRPPPTSTGIASLDAALGGGVRSGDLIGFTAPAGAGKTALLLTLFVNFAKAGARVVYLSCDLDLAEVGSRIHARAMYESDNPAARNLGFGDLLKGAHLKSDALRQILAESRTAADAILDGNVAVRQLPNGASDADVREIVMRKRAAEPDRPLVVIVDMIDWLYVDPVTPGASRRNASDVNRMTDVAKSFRRLADDAQAAIVFSCGASLEVFENIESTDNIFLGSSGANWAVTAGFALTTHPAGTDEKKLPGDWLEWQDNPSKRGDKPPRASDLGYCWAVLRFVKLRYGERVRVALAMVPGASVVYDLADDLASR